MAENDIVCMVCGKIVVKEVVINMESRFKPKDNQLWCQSYLCVVFLLDSLET